MSNKKLIYLSYGSEIEYRRTIFSIFSFFAWCQGEKDTVRIVIYTDSPEYFKYYLENKDVDYFLLKENMLQMMAGPEGFNHRVKVLVIAWAFDRYPGEDIVFIDSDTFLIASAAPLLKKIEPGMSFMHLREYQIHEALMKYAVFNQEHFPRAFLNYITDRVFYIAGEPICFNKYDYSWNSGIIGLSSNFSIYMPDILKLTDEFYANSKWFISEQLAFSFILQRKTEIIPTADLVYHYWGKRQKRLMDELLANYFSNDVAKVLNDQASIKSIILSYREKIDNDLIFEQVEIAISFKSWLYAGKKSFEVIFKNRFNIDICKQLITMLKQNKQS